MMKITREIFVSATGREPENDDLERCNCPDAGAIGHLCCGWHSILNLPQFDLGPMEWDGETYPNGNHKGRHVR